MATYCISDLHGRYDLYLKMLEKINFSNEDTLYILGDFVDRGDDGLKIVLDAGERSNVISLMGNHDFLALFVLEKLNDQIRPGAIEDIRDSLNTWFYNGGKKTYEEYKSLPPEKQKLALMTIDTFRDYAEVKVGKREFVLCHGGLKNYSPDKPLTDYTIEEILLAREDYSKPKFAKRGKYLVTGHTPTAAIVGATEGKIYRKNDHIAIDCGAVFGYGLGCICLDTMEEFYVK